MSRPRGRVAVALCLLSTVVFVGSADVVNWRQHVAKAASVSEARSNLPKQHRKLKVHRATTPVPQEVVMSVGGSIAHGWKSPHDNGYLQQAFAKLSKFTPDEYTYVDKTIIGANGLQLDTMYKGRYPKWLRQVKPNVVVISWGLLNDCKDKVSVADFDSHLLNEIQPALTKKAVVFVVTPPVTKASYTQYLDSEETLVQAEIDTVKSLNNPNVYLFDVFTQMKDYLATHNTTYVPYMGDAWHPNLAGHTLAGGLLYQDIVDQFGDQPITFTAPPSGSGSQTSGSGTQTGTGTQSGSTGTQSGSSGSSGSSSSQSGSSGSSTGSSSSQSGSSGSSTGSGSSQSGSSGSQSGTGTSPSGTNTSQTGSGS